jgi:hypothetical protein
VRNGQGATYREPSHAVGAGEGLVMRREPVVARGGVVLFGGTLCGKVELLPVREFNRWRGCRNVELDTCDGADGGVVWPGGWSHLPSAQRG